MLAPPLCSLRVSNILRKRTELKGRYRSFQQRETTEAANMTFTACKEDTRGVPNDFLGVYQCGKALLILVPQICKRTLW